MTNNGKYHDWPVILDKSAQLIRSRKVQPMYTALADALGVSRNSLDSYFHGLGITRELLPHPDKWPRPKSKAKPPRRDPDLISEQVSIDGVSVQRVIQLLRKRPMSLEELADRLDRGPKVVDRILHDMVAAGYGVAREEQVVKLPPFTAPKRAPTLSDEKSRRIVFAVASDWHIGSKAAQVSALNSFLDLAVNKHECQHVLVPGDICAGFGVYRGQANEVYATGSTEQLDALINTIPQYPGVSYYVMGGNHDYSFVKTAGYNIVEAACRLREDWLYLGYDEAVVPLTRDLDIVLWHPSGGVPYALTYRGQKFAAELAQRELVEIITGKKERPRTRFIFWGHLHVAASFPHGPIRVVGPGCFEGRTSYLKQKGLTPMIQGLVVEVYLTEDGLIQRYVPHEYAYVEQEDDWKNAFIPSVARRPQERITPMFSMAKK